MKRTAFRTVSLNISTANRITFEGLHIQSKSKCPRGIMLRLAALERTLPSPSSKTPPPTTLLFLGILTRCEPRATVYCRNRRGPQQYNSTSNRSIVALSVSAMPHILTPHSMKILYLRVPTNPIYGRNMNRSSTMRDEDTPRSQDP